VLAKDEADVGWLRPGALDETAAQRFARYTEGFSVEDEDAPPLPLVRFTPGKQYQQLFACNLQMLFSAWHVTVGTALFTT
jgi:hypothetical protein